MKNPKKTALMTRLFSGDEACASEVSKAIEDCKANGTAETETHNYGKVGDSIVIEDKATGELTKASDTPESYEMEAIKTASDPIVETPAETQKETEDQGDQKKVIATIPAEDLTKLVVSEVEKVMSAYMSSMDKRFADMEEKMPKTESPAAEEKKDEDQLEVEPTETNEEGKTFSDKNKEEASSFGSFYKNVIPETNENLPRKK